MRANSTVTTQYTLDLTTDALCIQNPPNAGTQTLCQALSSPVDAVLGFDIAPGVNVAAASTPANGSASRCSGSPGRPPRRWPR